MDGYIDSLINRWIADTYYMENIVQGALVTLMNKSVSALKAEWKKKRQFKLKQQFKSHAFCWLTYEENTDSDLNIWM